jgi:hypothetical protein
MQEQPRRYEKFRVVNTVLIVVLIIVLLMKGCGDGNNGPTEPVIIRDTTSIVTYDTVTNETVSYVPQYYERETIKYIHDTITQIEYKIEPTDTSAILEDYFAKYYYVDTVIHTDSITFIVYDTITQNQIAGRSSKYNILYPTITNTITEKHYINARELYLGFNTGFALKPFNLANANLGLLLRTKRRYILGLNGGVQFFYDGVGYTNFTPYIGASYYQKLTKK